MLKSKILICLLFFLMSSCSLIKHPRSKNFHRVKYNAHLKVNKNRNQKKVTVWVDSTEINKTATERIVRKDALVEIEKQTAVDQQKNHPKEHLGKATESVVRDWKREVRIVEFNEQMIHVDTKRKRIKVHDNEYWWDSDPKDWPWRDLILVLIALVAISMVIVLLASAIGGFLAGTIGFILFLLLIYYLIGVWTYV